MPCPRSQLLVALLAVSAACSEGTALEQEPAASTAAFDLRANRSAPPPAEVRTVRAGAAVLALWPWVGSDVSGTPSDPVNLLFVGRADPRAIRADLMSLDGNRAAFGFPISPPFDCRWSDTPSGDVQAGWTQSGGWLGGAIQLQCGDFAPIRFHLRLFRSGPWTVGATHFEVLIPGTTEHQVLSWELAEQLVTADLLRSGLLDPAAPVTLSGPLNSAPSFRTIPAVIFNGLPPELQAVAAGTPGNSTTDVPIRTDGIATILNLAGAAAPPRDTYRTFTMTYGQVIPKPFCNQSGDYVFVEGPVDFVESARLMPDGSYRTAFRGTGRLKVTPVNPFTGRPSGPSYIAEVGEQHAAELLDDRQRVESNKRQELLPGGAPGRGTLRATLSVDSRGVANGSMVIRCAP